MDGSSRIRPVFPASHEEDLINKLMTTSDLIAPCVCVCTYICVCVCACVCLCVYVGGWVQEDSVGNELFLFN